MIILLPQPPCQFPRNRKAKKADASGKMSRTARKGTGFRTENGKTQKLGNREREIGPTGARSANQEAGACTDMHRRCINIERPRRMRGRPEGAVIVFSGRVGYNAAD